MSFRAAFHTLGCKTNHYETDALRAQFTHAGFDVVPFTEQADVYLVNTCTVTGEADRKSRQMLRRARQKNPGALVVALGCQVVLGDAADWADLTIGTEGKSQAIDHVLRALTGRRLVELPLGVDAALPPVHNIQDSAAGRTYDEFGPVAHQSETRAYVKIEDGCNNFCSYCAIPFARGRVRSRGHDQIMAEIRALAAAGYREIILTGIHLCSYGLDRGLPGHAIMELALEIADVGVIERIRLGSLEPLSVTPEFIRLAAQNPKLCPQFHLSLQSGSDTVLARMSRRYRTADYREVVTGLRGSFADPGITTDLIVGFPGETDEEFADSLAFCKEMAFTRMHVFRFSARQGTRAAIMPDQVSPGLIGRRSKSMLELAGQMSLDYNRRQVGRIHTVLVERLAGGHLTGYTPEYVPIRLSAGGDPSVPDPAPGSILRVRGTRAEAEILLCERAETDIS